MKLSILLMIAGLAVGFLAGYWAAPGGSEPGKATGEQVDSPPRIKMVTKTIDPGSGGHPGADGPVKVVRRIRVPAKQEFADVAACTREVQRLAATVEELASENTEHKQLMEHETGKAIPFPEKLDPKYLEPALMKNLNKAFEEVGLDGDVSFVDCDEFPCIVCAGLGNQEEEMSMDKMTELLGKLRDSEAMSEYKESQRQNTISARREETDGGVTRTLNNCQAIYPDPEEDKLREELKKRLMWRMGQLNRNM